MLRATHYQRGLYMDSVTANSSEQAVKPLRGRPPRKLKEDETFTATGSGAEPEIKMDSQEKVGAYDYLIPFHGRSSLKVNEPRFFVNGKKLIKIVKVVKGYLEDRTPVYTIKRKLFLSINVKKPESRRFLDILRKKEIPGV